MVFSLVFPTLEQQNFEPKTSVFNEIRNSFQEDVWKALEVLLCCYRKAPIEKIKDAEKHGINFLILTEHKFFDVLNLKDFNCPAIKSCLVKTIR